MAGTVLYRKWRPQRFADIVGQDPIVRTLRNAVVQDKVAHAYLFTGPRGTGKTSTGRILAKAINTEHTADGEPIVETDEARAFEEGRALDLVEIDAASNRGIDSIRDLRERANYVPTSSRFKVYLIDEVHQLTDAAADALLKTLEEPPPHVVFILATTDPDALKSTILSRCQRFDFRRVGLADIAARLRRIADAEGITIPDEALDLIAREATGSLRDAINLLDQVWTTYGDAASLENTVAALGLSVDKRALDFARAAVSHDLKAGLAIITAVQEDALDLARFNRQVVQHLRHALLLQTGATDSLALSEPELEALKQLADGVEPADTVTALKAFSSADLRSDPYTSLPLELALAGLVYRPPPEAAPAPAPERTATVRDGGAPQRGRGQGARTGGSQRRQPPPRRQPRPTPPQPSSRAAGGTPAAPAGSQRADSSAPSRRRELTPQEQQLADILAQLDQRNEKSLAAWMRGSCKIVQGEDDVVTLAFAPTYVNMHKS
ncbi:MAG: DNA polymerase III subunit gamma/tau, partial [Dehalococcoidia bacterium]